ncbi:MAG: hypothetical protein EXQ88_03755 [Alphaproteobacteria bacterium]|nr:hypothetical protein [Alphaproteobacteria bacterium]
MIRRAFLAGAGASLMAAPSIVRAQQAQQKPKRLALFTLTRPVAEMGATGVPYFAAFHAELRRLGFSDGQNITISYWTGMGRTDFEDMAREVVASAAWRKPDRIYPGRRLER